MASTTTLAREHDARILALLDAIDEHETQLRVDLLELRWLQVYDELDSLRERGGAAGQ